MIRPRRRRRSSTLGTSSEWRGARAPKQARSVESLQRIVAAARDLLATADDGAANVADIARAAGVSVGAVYTHFPSKEHVVIHLLVDVADEIVERTERDLDPARWTDASLRDIVRFYLRASANAFTTHRWIMRPVTMIGRQSLDPELVDLLTETNRRIHGAFRVLAMARAHEIAHADPVAAIDVMLLMVSAAMREVFLYGEPVSKLAPSHERLIGELTNAAAAYLTAAIP